MRTYITGRLLLALIMLVAISILSFLVVGLAPYSGIDVIMSNVSGGAVYDYQAAEIDLRHSLGIDQPVWLHYLRWIGLVRQEDGRFRGILEGNLGRSLFSYDFQDP